MESVRQPSTRSGDGTPIRLVLADDHAIVRAGLRAELGSAFTVVGEADDAEGAIDVIAARRPDLALRPQPK